MMENNLNHEDQTPELQQLITALTDPYYTARNRDEANERPPLPNTDWVASKDFTVEVGLRQVHEYIATWGLPPAWLYNLDYLGVTEEGAFTLYHYKARFSKPTARSPIVSSACVYFTVNTTKPETLPVDVHFVIESKRFVHRAGSVVFVDKWLEDVIESKILQRQSFEDFWTDSA